LERQDYRDRTIAKVLKDDRRQAELQPTDHEYWLSEKAQEPVQPMIPVVRRAYEVKTKKIDWFWPNRVALGKLTLIAGNPDNGKSLASVWLAAACTTGRDFPDAENLIPPSDVLMLEGEDDIDDTVVPRLKVVKADLKRISFLEGMKLSEGTSDVDRDIKLDEDMKVIEAQLIANPSIRLVVIDPISNYLGGASMVAEQEIRQMVLIPLKRMAAQYNVAIILVMHLNKKNDLDAISRVGGAMAFVGVARCSWLFIRDQMEEPADGVTEKPEQTYSMLRIKNNIAKADKTGLSFIITTEQMIFDNGDVDYVPFVAWGAEVEHSADEALSKQVPKRGRGRPIGSGADKFEHAKQVIQDLLQDGPKNSNDVKSYAISQQGIKSETLFRAAADLEDKKVLKRYKIGRAWMWELNEIKAVTVKESDVPVDAGGEIFK